VNYNEVNSTWPTAGTTFNVGKGYIAVAPTTSGAITFTGALNTGDKSFTLYRTDSLVQKRGFNLVGNPYPSYLNWEKVKRTNVSPTMWYRSKSGGAYTFATYGAVSGEGTKLDGVSVTANIPPMQGFWVRVAGAGSGTLAFTNDMRNHSETTVNNLLKAPAATKLTQQVLRLQVSNGTNSDEAIVVFNPNASDGFDDFDSPKMTNANPVVPEIYTLADNEPVVINGFSTVYYNTEIPLGFTTGEANAFSIQATEINNFDDGTIVILKDNQKLTDQEQILSLDKPYNFTSDVFSSANRFSLIFRTTSITTGTNEELANQRILISKNGNNQITVNCLSGLNANSFVSVYNAQGKLLVTKQLTNRISILDTPGCAGIYFVKVVNGAKCVSEKLIF
jgi:hypothetical protein